MPHQLILRYRLPGEIPAADLESLDRLEKVQIVDRSPRMLMLEGDLATLEHFVESTPGWVLIPGEVQHYQLPDPRPKPRAPGQ